MLLNYKIHYDADTLYLSLQTCQSLFLVCVGPSKDHDRVLQTCYWYFILLPTYICILYNMIRIPNFNSCAGVTYFVIKLLHMHCIKALLKSKYLPILPFELECLV